MTTIEAGSAVNRGYYFDARTWSLHPVERDGEALPGGHASRWIRLPLWAAVAVAPLMGALFLVFLPLIGFVLVAQASVRPIAAIFTRSATEVAATLQPGWEPGEAHLTGKRSVEEAGERGEGGEDPLDLLAREIAVLRSARRAAAVRPG
jgi:hypothetical protein